MKKILFFWLCCSLFAACSSDEDESPLVGTWHDIYALGTVYDMQTGKVVGEHGYSAYGTTITFSFTGALTYDALGYKSEGSYSLSGNTLKMTFESETIFYIIEELSSGKLLLSKEIIDQEKQLREIIVRVFIKTGYQLTYEDILKYTGPYNDWGVKR